MSIARKGKFVLESRTRDGSFVAALPYSNMQGEWQLNNAGALRFSLWSDRVTPQQFYPGIHEVWLWRLGQLIFQGPAWDATKPSGSRLISCAAEGFMSYFDNRRIDVDYNPDGDFIIQDDIVWDWISAAQQGQYADVRVGRGAVNYIASSVPGGPLTLVRQSTYRDTSYAQADGVYVLTAINDMAILSGGFEWEQDQLGRKFDMWSATKPATHNVIDLTYGINLDTYSIQYRGKYVGNDILVQGADSVIAIGQNPASQAIYGLQQKTISVTDADEDATAARVTQELLNRNSTLMTPEVTVRAPSLNPFDGSISTGDIVNITIDDGWAQLRQQMRVTGFQATIGSEDQETFTFYLNDLRGLDNATD